MPLMSLLSHKAYFSVIIAPHCDAEPLLILSRWANSCWVQKNTE